MSGCFFFSVMMLYQRADFPGTRPAKPSQAKLATASIMFRAPAFDGRRHSITDKASALAERAIRSQPVAAANRIEYRIDAGGALDEILVSIIDGYAAERSHQIVLGLRRGAEHFQPGERAELQRGRSYAAGGSVNQHAFALAQIGDAMDQLIGGGVVQNQADRFGGIESGGNLAPVRIPAARCSANIRRSW